MSDQDDMIPKGLDKNAENKDGTATPDGRPHSKQPRWRQDFPIDWGRDEYVSRRELTKFIVLTSAAFFVGQAWLGVRKVFGRSKRLAYEKKIATVGELPIGGAKTFTYPEGSTSRLLVRVDKQDFVAYDQACTHLMCPVVPAVNEGKLHCPCHNGWFDLKTGQVLAGPPQRALPKVFLDVRGEEVWATGVEGQVL